jgi:RHS repeat-associated protein
MTNHAPANTVISTYAYTLDGVGNRTRTDLNEPMMPSYNAETVNYTYSSGNILTSADGNAYTHDANGNRTTKTNGTNITTYTYDSLNRLTAANTTSRQIQYLYNGLGQRVGKIDNGVQTNYLIDPNGILPQVLAETDASNNLISFYVYDGAGLVAKITPQNQYYLYHYDGLGSTIAISDSTGQVVNTYCYSPEGLVGAQENIPNPFQYVGRFGVMAEGNGLYFMRARYHDPETGSFISKDPIGYASGMNLYGYVENDPINWIDPSGLQGQNRQLPNYRIKPHNQPNPIRPTSPNIRYTPGPDPTPKVLPKNYNPKGINNLPGKRMPISRSTPKGARIFTHLTRLLNAINRYIGSSTTLMIVVIPPELNDPRILSDPDLFFFLYEHPELINYLYEDECGNLFLMF